MTPQEKKIEKLEEMNEHYKDYFEDHHEDSFYLMDWMKKTKQLESELAQLQGEQERDKTAVELVREAFQPIQMGANMVTKDGVKESTECYPEKFVEWLTNAQLYFRDGYEMTLQGAYKHWKERVNK